MPISDEEGNMSAGTLPWMHVRDAGDAHAKYHVVQDWMHRERGAPAFCGATPTKPGRWAETSERVFGHVCAECQRLKAKGLHTPQAYHKPGVPL